LVHAPLKVRASDFIQAPDVISAPTVPETLVSEYIRKESIKYTVKSGDTLSSIGTSFKITADALIYANSLDEDAVLRVGQELSIPPVDGIVHTVKRGDTVASLAKKFAVPEQSIIEFNYLFEPFVLKAGDSIVIPDAKIPPPPPKVIFALPIPKGPVPSGTGQFLWPVQTRYITQYFTFYHNGIDIGGYSPIFATDGGRIVSAGWNPWGLGNAVKIDHGNGFTSTYGHLSRIDVYVGQDVGRGQVIGMTGNTGRSFGTHLHFIIQLAGKYVNPLSYL
jgi:murein DD-endopeptidase MepM/ murein hydrolase activator NlpD